MGFTTYENTHNPHVTIHRDGCSEIEKRGGVHKYGQGEYRRHNTYADAFNYANNRAKPGWEIIQCSHCKPA